MGKYSERKLCEHNGLYDENTQLNGHKSQQYKSVKNTIMNRTKNAQSTEEKDGKKLYSIH